MIMHRLWFTWRSRISVFLIFNILHLPLPLTGRLLSDLAQFDQLITLHVTCFPLIDANTTVYQLQSLIDRAPHLHSLDIQVWLPLIIEEIPSNLICHSIRLLHFHGACRSLDKTKVCFNSQQCSAFLRSRLASQCELLYIIMEKRTDILHLVNGLPIFELGMWSVKVTGGAVNRHCCRSITNWSSGCDLTCQVPLAET
jgi:hypothetical protein